MDLFTPSSGPFGAGLLDGISGGAASRMFGAQPAGTGEFILGTVFAILNLAVILFCTITAVAAWYETAAETAARGDKALHAAHPYRMIGRIGAGLILLMPAKGGLSLIQLAVIWLAALGTGLADHAWKETAPMVLAAQTALRPHTDTNLGGSADQVVANRFSTALLALVQGMTCAEDFNDIAEALGRPGPRMELEETYGSSGGWTTAEWTFRDKSAPPPDPRLGGFSAQQARANYDNTSRLCGSLKMFVASKDAFAAGEGFALDADPTTTASGAFQANQAAKAVYALSVTVVMESARQAMREKLIPAARTITSLVRDGQRVRQAGFEAGGEAEIEATARRAVREATLRFLGLEKDGVARTMAGVELYRSSLERGWIFAATWQRMGAEVSRAVIALRTAADVAVPMRPMSVRQYFRTAISGGSVLSDLARANDEHMQTLAQMTPFWQLPVAATANPTEGDQTSGPDATRGMMQRIWASLTRSMSFAGRDPDPMRHYAEVGSELFTALALMISADVLLSIGQGLLSLVHLDGALQPLQGMLQWMMEMTGYGGMALAIVLPTVPALYYLAAILGWLGLVLECLFAMPVLLISLFAPSRGEGWLGSSLPAVKTLFGLVLRPFLIFGGLMAAMAFLSIASPIVDQFFQPFMSLANPGTGLLGMVTFGVLTALYCIACFATVLLSCAFITRLGDWVMEKLGAFANGFSREHLSDHVVVSGNPANRLGPAAGAGPRMTASGKDAGRGLGEKLRGRLRGPGAAGGTKP